MKSSWPKAAFNILLGRHSCPAQGTESVCFTNVHRPQLYLLPVIMLPGRGKSVLNEYKYGKKQNFFYDEKQGTQCENHHHNSLHNSHPHKIKQLISAYLTYIYPQITMDCIHMAKKALFLCFHRIIHAVHPGGQFSLLDNSKQLVCISFRYQKYTDFSRLRGKCIFTSTLLSKIQYREG